MKYCDVNSRPETVGEKNDGVSKVVKIGYIPPKVKIEQMIMAGINLAKVRSQYDYDSEEEVDFDASDPTRDKNFDFADASRLQRAADSALSEQKRKIEEANTELRRKALQEEKVFRETLVKKAEAFDKLQEK